MLHELKRLISGHYATKGNNWVQSFVYDWVPSDSERIKKEVPNHLSIMTEVHRKTAKNTVFFPFFALHHIRFQWYHRV
jgi:hypothetical protein